MRYILVTCAALAALTTPMHFVNFADFGKYEFAVKLVCFDDNEASAIFGNDLRCFNTSTKVKRNAL